MTDEEEKARSAWEAKMDVLEAELGILRTVSTPAMSADIGQALLTVVADRPRACVAVVAVPGEAVLLFSGTALTDGALARWKAEYESFPAQVEPPTP